MCDHLNVVNSLPENWFLVKSETGGMISNTFFEYIAYSVHNWLNEHNIQRTILLFVYGLISQIILDITMFCKVNGIIFFIRKELFFLSECPRPQTNSPSPNRGGLVSIT